MKPYFATSPGDNRFIVFDAHAIVIPQTDGGSEIIHEFLVMDNERHMYWTARTINFYAWVSADYPSSARLSRWFANGDTRA